MHLANFNAAQVHRRQARGSRGFTMIEIAISIGIIGFALVAIIGILPAGLNVQKDNREDTIVNQDANFFMQAIRNGAVFTNRPGYGFIPFAPGLDFLTNYVQGVMVSNTYIGVNYYTNDPAAPGRYLLNGGGILGLLTTPEFLVSNITGIYSSTNYVRAWVRGINGSAMEQNGSNSFTAFRYVMDVQISPFVSFPASVTSILAPGDPNLSRQQEAQYMCHNLYEAELTFHWPVLANGSPGPNHQTFRGTISGHLSTSTPGDLQASIYYAFQPQTYLTNWVQ